MAGTSWFAFDRHEQAALIEALQTFKSAKGHDVERLVSKMLDGGEHPDITVGVYGGQVQWVLGNPFPIRICDYDGDQADLPAVDERGQKCRMWLEPADSAVL